MSNLQTVISIRRDKVNGLRLKNKKTKNFLKLFLEFHSISNYPAYLEEEIFVSHAEDKSINTCNLITPFLGSPLTNTFHKSFSKDGDNNIIFNDKQKIIDNLIMGYKGVFEVKNINELELQTDFATSKNSFYSVFGIHNKTLETLTKEDFEKILDIVDFVETDKNKEQELINSLNPTIEYMGSFAQRQVCLAYQSNGVFKAYPFKANKGIHFDVKEIIEAFKEEAAKINPRFSHQTEEFKKLLFLTYVSSYDFREELGNRLFEAFIKGIKGDIVKVES